MSVKAIALVWDFPCPQKIGETEFKPSHKYVLVAYADHADHNGKNIYPAVPTIAAKTGLDDRTIQRLTHDLEEMGLLVGDGYGPRGTNRWQLPFSAGGDKLSPVAICRGDKNQKSLGDIPSGDIPSGDKLTPELKEPEPMVNLNMDVWEAAKAQLQSTLARNIFEKLADTRLVRYDSNVLTVGVENNELQGWLEDRATKTVERMLIGILNQADITVEFVVMGKVPA
jgi:hypothetical protein